MDIVTLLKQDHRKVKELFERFEAGSRRKEKQRIAEEIIEELSLHASIEEQLVYPLLRMRDRKHEDGTLEALEEHHVAKLLLAELDQMKVGDERYDAKMTVLAENIRHHIGEEESELLPRLVKLTSDEERARIADAIPRMKELAPNHPHPKAPDTPPGNALSGFLAKVLDTTRDVSRLLSDPDKGRARMAAKTARRRAAARTDAGSDAKAGVQSSTRRPASPPRE
jgi:hemerythrin superfamily protein